MRTKHTPRGVRVGHCGVRIYGGQHLPCKVKGYLAIVENRRSAQVVGKVSCILPLSHKGD